MPLVVVQEHHAAVGGNQSKRDLEDLVAERRDARAELDRAGDLVTRAKLLVVASKRGVVFDQLFGEEGLLREDRDLRANQGPASRVADLETLGGLARLPAQQGVEGDPGRLGSGSNTMRVEPIVISSPGSRVLVLLTRSPLM